VKGAIPVVLVLLRLVWPAGARGQFNYQTNAGSTNTLTITGYTGAGGVVAIPSTINGLAVTGIGG
jgi:hypothetical protein